VLDAVEVIGVVDGGSVNDGILAVAVVVDAEQRGTGRVDMEPLGKEDVDLVHVLSEGGVAGLVVGDVIGGAQTFAGVERDFRGLAFGFAACGTDLGAAQGDAAVGKGLEVVLRGGKQELRQTLKAKDVEDESSQNQSEDDGGDVEDAAKTFPSFALRVEEYLFIRHIGTLLFYLGRKLR